MNPSPLEIIQQARKSSSDARYERAHKHLRKAGEAMHRMHCRRHLPGYKIAERYNAIDNPFSAIAAALR